MQSVQIQTNAILNLVFQISIFDGFSYFKRVLTPCGGYRNPQKPLIRILIRTFASALSFRGHRAFQTVWHQF